MADTPIQPASGSLAANGIALALALSLVITPVAGSLSATATAGVVSQATSTVIAPSVGAVAFAGVAPGFSKPTVTAMVPTVGAASMAGVASTVAQQNQNPNPIAGTLPLLYNAVATGSRFWWSGGKGLFSVVAANFNGATVTLNLLGPDGVTMMAASTATTFTVAGAAMVELPPCYVQAAITSGPPTGVYAAFARIPTELG